MIAYLQSFWNLLFPKTCVACHERVLVQTESFLCTYCRSALPQTDYHVYPADNPLYEKIIAHVPIRHALAFLSFTKSGKTQQILHYLKYKNLPELGEELGRHYGQILAEHAYQQHFDALVPIPLHAQRLKKRGYNQSYHFALGMAQSMGLPVWGEVVIREQASQTQTRKTRLQRWQNVENIFTVTQPVQVAGKRILLVDDVITTGATTSSCAEALLQAHCRELSCASLATA